MSERVDAFEVGLEEDWTVLYSYQNIAGVPEMIHRFEQQESGRPLLQRDVSLLLTFLFAVELKGLEQSRPTYLSLPAAIQAIEQEECYLSACALGRLWYRLSQFEMNEETYEVERVPNSYTRQELFEDVSEVIRLADARLAASLPLAYRVGYCVGWLSGLAVSQPDEVQAVLVMLAALVKPLLLGAAGVQRKTKRSGKKAHAKKLPVRARSGRQ